LATSLLPPPDTKTPISPHHLFPFCRTISKKIKIFEDFVQGKKKLLIDALKRNGIEFREEGGEEEMTEKGDKNGDENWLTKNSKAKRRKGTIIVGSGVDCITILPPYEKVVNLFWGEGGLDL